jgi:hypothetical protein
MRFIAFLAVSLLAVSTAHAQQSRHERGYDLAAPVHTHDGKRTAAKSDDWSPRPYGGFADDQHGEQAAKAGMLTRLVTRGSCGTGFKLVQGEPGDQACYKIDGRLRCPNKCVPDGSQ